MKKKYGIFWLEQQRKIYNGDDVYWSLGMLYKIVDSYEEAEQEINYVLKSSEGDLLTILPIYREE